MKEEIYKKKALITKRALETKKIYFMYHENPDNQTDSGWRFFHGEDTQGYVDNSENIKQVKIKEIILIEPKIEKYLGTIKTIAYIRKENYNDEFIIKDDFEFDVL